MADSAVFNSSELLCNVPDMLRDGLIKQLKIVVAAFYTKFELEHAWILLQTSIDELMGADAPRLSKRRGEIKQRWLPTTYRFIFHAW